LLFVVATAVAIAVQRLAVSQVIKQVDNPMIEITLTTIAAYGSFLATEHFHYSGVIATDSAANLLQDQPPAFARARLQGRGNDHHFLRHGGVERS